MKSHVYLNPMSPDGKPGEVKEIVYEDAGPQQYVEPFADNDATGKLRHDLHAAAAKLRHAKARGKGVAEAKKAHEAAKSAAGKAHYDQQQQRLQQRTGIDYGAPSPFSRDTRQFMEPVPYFSRNVTDDDYDEADDEEDDTLEVKILAAVEALEQAQAEGASPAKMLKLEEALRVLREQLQDPLREEDPLRRTTAPTGRAGDPNNDGLIVDPTAKGKKAALPVGQAAAPAATAAAWDKHLKQLDAKLAKRALAAIRAGEPTAPAATHSADVCCEGKYKCARCRAKAAAA